MSPMFVKGFEQGDLFRKFEKTVGYIVLFIIA